MKKIVVCIVAGLVFGMSLVLTATSEAGEYAKGKKLYGSHCQICHGEKGDGKGPAGAALSPRPADFTKPGFWEGDVDKKITDTILHGHGPMPAFNLKPDEIKAIIDYMTHSFRKEK
jgi:mono/diheme cytochrome c family protein